MVRRHKPRPGYMQVPTYGDVGPVEIDREDIETLARNHRIPVIHRDALKIRLEDALRQYLWQRHNFDDAPKPGEQRAALSRLRGLALQLRDALGGLDGSSLKLFQEEVRTGEEVLVALLDLKPEEPLHACSLQGHEYDLYPLPHDGYTVNRVRHTDLDQALRIIERCAVAALGKVEDDSGGRPARGALDYWVGDIAQVWTDLKGKPFKVYRHKGEAISKAAEFCRDAVWISGPEIAEATILQAAEKARKNFDPDTF